MKHIILICVIFVQIYAGLQAQNIECIGNTITVTLKDYTDGNIQWQFSNNNLDWNDLAGATGTILTHNVVETGYYRAKVNYGRCVFFGDTEYIIAYPLPSIANAGADQIITTVDIVVTLEANTPSSGISNWSIVSGGVGSFGNDADPTTTFTCLQYGKYKLKWSISTECKSNSDEVNIIFYDPSKMVSDIDGNIYNTVEIGSQIWTVENLKTTKFSDGTFIPLIEDVAVWSSLTTPGYCWYNNDKTTNKDPYGALYNWYTVNTGLLCPEGWHVSTDAEWKTLEMYLGMSQAEADGTGWRGTDQGTQLKSTSGWNSSGNGPDTYGFTAIPAGLLTYSGVFSGPGIRGDWWTISSNGSGGAHARELYYFQEKIYRGDDLADMKNGFSVRCLKD